jgi:hypothetical protein
MHPTKANIPRYKNAESSAQVNDDTYTDDLVLMMLPEHFRQHVRSLIVNHLM